MIPGFCQKDRMPLEKGDYRRSRLGNIIFFFISYIESWRFDLKGRK